MNTLYKRLLVCLFFISISFPAFCQEKGITLEDSTESTPIGNIYAIIIGISDYAHIKPPLKYGHTDALNFYNFLIQDIKCDPKNLKLLINNEVNRDKIFDARDSILLVIKPNDRLFFYFSGHGGTESPSSDDMAGMLFLTECPTENFRRNYNYIYTLQDLKELIQQVNEKKAVIVTILDACHAGEFMFAGGIEGTNKVLNALQTNWMNEIKLLACQAGEQAIEDPKYGGGRGIFSYFLVNGLQKNLFKNTNGIILNDLDDYVRNKVREATNNRQTPIPVGNRNFVIFSTPKPNVIAFNSPQIITLPVTLDKIPPTSIPSIRILDEKQTLNALIDDKPSILNKYRSTLKSGQIFKPEHDCAYYYYKQYLSDSTYNRAIQGKMINELVKVVSGKADSLTNDFLDGKVGKINSTRIKSLLDDLMKVNREIGKQSSYSASINCKENFLNSLLQPDSLAIESLQKALEYDYYAPFVLRSLTERYAKTKQEDLAIKYLLRYVEVLPNDSCALVSLKVISEDLNQKKAPLLSLTSRLGFKVSLESIQMAEVASKENRINVHNESSQVKKIHKDLVEKFHRAEYEIIVEGEREKFIDNYNISQLGNLEKSIQNGKNRFLLDFKKEYSFIIAANGYESFYIKFIPSIADFDNGFRKQVILKKEDTGQIAVTKKIDVDTILPSKRYALIIGNSRYSYDKPLRSSLNDADDMSYRLETIGFKVLKYNDLQDRKDFEEAFRSFSHQAKNAEVVLFFYAGHGVEVEGEKYVIPTNAKLTSPEAVSYEAFSIKRIMDEFSQLQAKNSIILLDACNRNPFHLWGRGNNLSFNKSDIMQIDMDNFFVGYSNSNYSASAGVIQDEIGRNGVFTSALLKFFKRGQSFDDIFQKTVNDVRRQTNGVQRPFRTSSLRKNLVF